MMDELNGRNFGNQRTIVFLWLGHKQLREMLSLAQFAFN